MGIKCDRCDNEATVHEVSVRNGMKVERHLCETCAAQHGIEITPGGTPNVKHLVKALMTQAPIAGGPAVQVPMGRLPACLACKLTFADFKQQGMLGCPECYRCFEAFLGPLIERAQEGGVSHCGKAPARLLSGAPAGSPPPPKPASATTAPTVEEQIERLRQELEQAVKREQYEVAAKVRDAIRMLSKPSQEGSLDEE